MLGEVVVTFQMLDHIPVSFCFLIEYLLMHRFFVFCHHFHAF